MCKSIDLVHKNETQKSPFLFRLILNGNKYVGLL